MPERVGEFPDYLKIILVVGGVALAIFIICLICYQCKACKASEFEEVPVTGHQLGLTVIPVSINGYFLKSESTVLKLREKNFSWSGDDCTVKVLILVFKDVQICYSLHNLLRKNFSVLLHIVDAVFYHADLTMYTKSVEKCVKKLNLLHKNEGSTQVRGLYKCMV